MTENILLIGFILFVILLLVLVFIVRNLSVRDILDEDVSIKVTPTPQISANDPFASQAKKASRSTTIPQKQERSFELNRENLNKFSKLLSVVGVIALFLPLPKSIKFFGIAFLFVGSILSKLTQTDKKKNIKKPA